MRRHTARRVAAASLVSVLSFMLVACPDADDQDSEENAPENESPENENEAPENESPENENEGGENENE
jgi:hypothetical protein